MKEQEYLIWVSRAHLLTEAQVSDLMKRLKLGGKDLDTGGSEYHRSSDWLLPGIEGALKRRHMLSNTSLITLYRSKGFKLYLKNFENICSSLEKQVGKVNKKVLAYHVGEALVMYCKRRKITSASRIVSMVHCSIEAINEAFPGYMKSGLFKHILEVDQEGIITFNED